MRLAVATFAPHVGEPFTAIPSLGGDPVTLTLTACEPSAHAQPGRERFSLLFGGGGPLPQQIVALSHDRLGAVELFLVPLGPDLHQAVIDAEADAP